MSFPTIYIDNDFDEQKIGTTIEHYYIIKVIGKGNEGVVYLANDTRNDQKVAIKIQNNSESTRASIKHHLEMNKEGLDYVVKIYDTFIHNDNFVIVMEFIQDNDIEKIIKSWSNSTNSRPLRLS